MHANQLGYIIETLKNPNAPKTIVVTHHAPSYKMLDKKNKTLNSYYATDLEHLFKPPLVAWFSGHTHVSKEITIGLNNIVSISNCFGYPTQMPKETGYSQYLVLELK